LYACDCGLISLIDLNENKSYCSNIKIAQIYIMSIDGISNNNSQVPSANQGFDVARIGKTLFPFLSLYKPLTQPIAILSGSLRTIASGSQLFQASKEDLPVEGLRTAVAVAALAGTILAHPLGMAVSTVEDIAFGWKDIFSRFGQDDWQGAAVSYAQVINNYLFLGVLFYGGMPLILASSTMQVLLGLYHSSSEFKQGNYLEAAGHFAMSMIKLYGAARPIYSMLSLNPNLERRAVVDVGSGSTKFCIADVDQKTNRIAKILLNESYAVPYQASLEASEDHTFGEEVRTQGIKAFTKIQGLCQEYGVQKTTAVATEAFRKSQNAASFAAEVLAKTSLSLKIIPQQEEGAIAFSSVSSQDHKIPLEQLVVWDIGTGSYQLTVKGKEEEVCVSMGSVGSVPFRNYIKEQIQHKDPSESILYPFSQEDYLASDRYARSLARKTYAEVKERIRSREGEVVGVGRLFLNSLLPHAESQEITRADLRNYIRDSLGRPKEEFDDPFAEVDLANATLVLGFMKSLGIHRIKPVNAATLQGMLIYQPYWA
jgi:exopolyphosphatase/guanosine-5'-triphosphate,3'-diphosphate pyrophosphatase